MAVRSSKIRKIRNCNLSHLLDTVMH